MSVVLHGIGVGGGIAIGRARLVSHNSLDVAHYTLEAQDIPAEIARFDEAIRSTRKQLEMLWGSIPENAPTELGAFLSLHIMLLNDATLSREPRHIIDREQCNAEWALKIQADALIEQFESIEEAYLRERKHDVQQVVERIFKNLVGQEELVFEAENVLDDAILVAHDLSPADMVFFRDANYAAFVTDVGGTTSHTAILARSLDLPATIATHSAHQLIQDDEMIIVDGQQGVVIVDPDEGVLAEYRRRLRAWRSARNKLAGLKKVTTQTLDGTPIELHANIELPQDAKEARESGAGGIGLFRSEFLFMGRDTLPNEQEQFEAYQCAASAMKGLPVTIRTIDLGADKNPKWAIHGTGDNPALGLSGIRLCLLEPQLFRTQLRAILRASAFGKVRILLPMIQSVGEIQQARAHLEQAKAELTAENIAFDHDVELGAMIEVPAAALTVTHIARHVDFLSIGTNDLIQYTLAIDRNDDSVSPLYDPTHPAVLHLIALTLKTAGRLGLPVSVCGEMAGNERFTRLLLGMGLRKFSMHPASLLTVKQIAMNTHLDGIATLTGKILRAGDPDKIQDLLAQLNDLSCA